MCKMSKLTALYPMKGGENAQLFSSSFAHKYIFTNTEASYEVGYVSRVCEQLQVAAKQTASGQDVVGRESRKRV